MNSEEGKAGRSEERNCAITSRARRIIGFVLSKSEANWLRFMNGEAR
jgi:hypothetical protein